MKHIPLVFFFSISIASFAQKQVLMTSQMDDKVLRYDVEQDKLIQVKALEEISDVEIDADAQLLFWADFGNHSIVKYDLNSGKRELLLTNLSGLNAIFLDSENEKLYFSLADNTISTVNYDGSERRTIIRDLAGVTQFAIDFIQNTMFYIDQAELKVMKTDLDNIDPVELTDRASNVTQLILDETNQFVYWIQTAVSNVSSGLRSIAYDGGDRNDIVKDFMNGGTIDFENQLLFTTDNFGRYYQYNLDGTGEIRLFNQDFLLSVQDPSTKEIYVFTEDEELLYKLSDDGMGYQLNLELLRESRIPKGLFLNPEDKRVYNINGGQGLGNVIEGGIVSYDLNGKNVKHILNNNEDIVKDPINLALDVGNKHIYWTDDNAGEMFRCDFDGSNIIEVHANRHSHVSPYALKIDFEKDKIYWSDLSLWSLHSSNLDGTDEEELYRPMESPSIRSIEIIGEYVYWIESSDRYLKRMKKDGSGDIETVLEASNFDSNPRRVTAFDDENLLISVPITGKVHKYNITTGDFTLFFETPDYKPYDMVVFDASDYPVDSDGDGFFEDEDCDDDNLSVHPHAEDVANNMIDENCNGTDFISSTIDTETLSSIINIYPNPFSDIIHISSDFEVEKITIKDMLGKDYGTYHENEINLSFLISGFYFVTVQIENRQEVIKVFKY